MMNQKRSHNLNRLKVAGILPLLALTLWAFAQPVYHTTSTWVSNDITNTASQQEITIKGKVIDSETGQSISSASVIIINTTSGTITDNDGVFIIQMPAGASLAISYIGYQTEKILVNDETYREIRLAPRYYSLKPVENPANRKNKPTSDEKVISGEVFKIVEALPYYKDPQNQKLFEEVKKATAKYAAQSGEKGTLTVGFNVTAAGQVSEIKTMESSNPRLNEAAEKIIRELKNWEPGRQRGKTVDTRLKLTLVFE
jgi:TonB family protein